MDINYIHNRQQNFEGKPFTKGGSTIAWRINSEARRIEVALAFCSEKDVFNRKVGRKQATDRLEGGQIAIFSEKELLTYTAENLVPTAFRDSSTIMDMQLEELSTGWLQNFIVHNREAIWNQLLENKHAPVYYTKPVVADDGSEQAAS